MDAFDPADRSAGDDLGDALPPSRLTGLFRVDEVRRDGDRVVYLGDALVAPDHLEREVWPLFREAGYEVRFTTVSEQDPVTGVDLGGERHALVATPRSVGVQSVPWTNVVMFGLTVLTTLFAGTIWYYVDLDGPLDLLRGWPFAAAVMSVLLVHELGHYVMSRYHDVDASLPYFIPVPTIIGTLGAVIRMKGRIPDRDALFDIGVAGPLAGLVMAVIVSLVGLYLPPIEVPPSVLNSPDAVSIEFGFPPLLLALSAVTGQPLTYPDQAVAVNPVVFGGWVGLFVTFLNLIPVGQLDGGHLVRAMLGERQETLGALVPAGLFGLAGYLYVFANVGSQPAILWGFWGLLTLWLAYVGPATPVYDEPLDRKRVAVGLLTFALGALCFTPVPFQMVT